MLAEEKLIVTDSPISEVKVKRWCKGEMMELRDKVAEETPIALIYNGVSHAVMLATPQDLEDFALGFSLSEGILQDKSELYGIEIVAQSAGVELHMEIASASFAQLKEKRRNLVGRTGCGLCGAESLAQALRLPTNQVAAQTQLLKQKLTQEKILRKKNDGTGHEHSSAGLEASIDAGSRASIAMTSIARALNRMQAKQLLQQATGATHACAWANENGEVALVREDVGRHNAMDKLIGALAQNPQQESGFVLTSSRASYEMVQKIAQAGLHMLVAISAPTGLAIRLAEACDVSLVGFVRDQQCVIYTHADRIRN